MHYQLTMLSGVHVSCNTKNQYECLPLSSFVIQHLNFTVLLGDVCEN